MLKQTPILVQVTEDGNYVSYGNPRSFRDRHLAKMLDSKLIGGINETVEPGLYDFNIYWKGLTLYSSLEPHV